MTPVRKNYTLPWVFLACFMFWWALLSSAWGQQDYRRMFDYMYPWRGYATVCVVDDDGQPLDCRNFQTRETFDDLGECRRDLARRNAEAREVAIREGFRIAVGAECRRDRTVTNA